VATLCIFRCKTMYFSIAKHKGILATKASIGRSLSENKHPMTDTEI